MLLRLLSTLLLSSPVTGAWSPLGPASTASSSAGLLGDVVVDLGLLALGVLGALGVGALGEGPGDGLGDGLGDALGRAWLAALLGTAGASSIGTLGLSSTLV